MSIIENLAGSHRINILSFIRLTFCRFELLVLPTTRLEKKRQLLHKMYERNEKKKVAKKVGEKYKKILTVDNATEIAIKNQVGTNGITLFHPFCKTNQLARYLL